MKEVYRNGLAVRYGRIMQAISGVHFNYSVPVDFWPVFQEAEEDSQPLDDFISDAYFALARNILRYDWLLSYLFGNSPALCKSFLSAWQAASRARLNQSETQLQEFDAHTLYEPYATTLRMTNMGYKNSVVSDLCIPFANLQDYTKALRRATETVHPPYEKYGVRHDGKYQQLNTHILQIENEFYSSVRPKRIGRDKERPLAALEQYGVQYIELRSLDVNAFDSVGVHTEQLRFLETFMLFCLLHESPLIDAQEQLQLEENQLIVAHQGREPALMLHHYHGTTEKRSLQEWALEVLQKMLPIAAMLDSERAEPLYTQAIQLQLEKVENPEQTPSARTIATMRENGESFFEFAFRLAEEHRDFLTASPLSQEKMDYFSQLAVNSLEEQVAIEAHETLSFEEYLEEFFCQ